MCWYVNEKKYLKKILNYNENLDISHDLYVKVINDNSFFPCKYFSCAHYNFIYELFKEKLSNFSNKDEKIKYLNTQICNFENLQSTKIIDIGLATLAGGFFGVNIFDLPLPSWLHTTVYLWVIALAGFFYKKLRIVYKSNEWNFYLKVLNQIKMEIANE